MSNKNNKVNTKEMIPSEDDDIVVNVFVEASQNEDGQNLIEVNGSGAVIDKGQVKQKEITRANTKIINASNFRHHWSVKLLQIKTGQKHGAGVIRQWGIQHRMGFPIINAITGAAYIDEFGEVQRIGSAFEKQLFAVTNTTAGREPYSMYYDDENEYRVAFKGCSQPIQW